LCSMIPMSFVVSGWLQRAAWCGAVAALAACSRNEPKVDHRGVRPMDGLERYTARKVSLETAVDAIEQRDVKKLKMLSVYVRKRDRTALFSEDDLSSLDLAIACLEGAKSQEERTAALGEIKSGQLKAAARGACFEEQE
jgi:hypothetical protein